MQLNRRQHLALVALGLVSGTSTTLAAPPASEAGQTLQLDSGLLWYQENNNRIRDLEAIVSVRQSLSEDSAWSARLLVDTVCGGSPIGALPSKASQSFVTPTATSLNPPVATQTTTSASGGGDGGGLSLCSNPVQNQKYTTAPGDLPIDQSFHDQRVALSGGFETAVGRQDRVNAGLALSHELDFFSTSVNALWSHDMNQRNTTLALGMNIESDRVSPVGGAPVPGSLYGDFRKTANQSKTLQDLLVGVTQVVSRRWITQGNVSLERSSGYETDPYKIITEVDTQGYDAAGLYRYESRPGSRRRYALYWDNKYAFDQDVLQVSYRHAADSWGIRSDTLEAHYRLALGERSYLEPHLRAYHQTAADFYRLYLVQGAPAVDYASADPRLGGFTGQTLGIKYGMTMGESGELSLRLERYVQRGTVTGSSLPGLQGLDLYPGMNALLVQLGLRASF